MKKFILLTGLMLVCGVCLAGEQKIAVVDMNKLLRSHPDTEQAESVLEEQIAGIEKDRDSLVEKLGKMRDEVEDVLKQAQNRALSEKKRDQLREEAEEKYKQLRKMDVEAKREMDDRRKDISEQKLMMHKRIVSEIADVIEEYSKKNGYAFVIDSSAVGVSGMPAVIHADESADITAEIEKLIAKKKD